MGALARATRLSPKALRLYDESRLLEPVHDHGETSDWKPRRIFLCDPATAEATDIVYESAIALRD